LLHFGVDAQITITGRVTESNTSQPIPYVNIFVKGSLEGTQTNFDGYFSFVTNKLADSLKASYLGYKILVKKINKKENAQTIDFELIKDVTNLNEVVIKAGENPALRIIRKSIQYKDNYNKRRLQNYSYNSYTKLQVFVDNVGPKFRRLRIFRPLVKYYKKLDGYDHRYDNTIEQFINDKFLLNKIERFLINKKLFNKLIKIIKQRNESLDETMNKGSNNSSMVYHQYESDIFEQIRQYNNDNRNKSELTHDILAGGLLNDW
jgi:hypothetical protein